MCGVIGYLGNNALEQLIKGLKTLEYRGYDSSGVAFIYKGETFINKSVGEIKKLEEKIEFDKYKDASIGIAHTRWATHGEICNKNAHPFDSNNVVLVHNGIIENYLEIKEFLLTKGYNFKSDVDSEVVVHLIDYYYKDHNYLEAIDKALKNLKGMYSFLILFKDKPDSIYGAKKDSPLFIGTTLDKTIISSDLSAIIETTNQYYPLNNNEIFQAKLNEVKIYDENLTLLNRELKTSKLNKEAISKQGYKHYMLKEIYEQKEIFNMLKSISLNNLKNLFEDIHEIVIVACGSAMHAGLVGKYLFEELLHLKTSVLIASEFRYSPFIYNQDTLFIFISQSGETADTIAALRLVKEHKGKTLGIVNVIGSTIANECDNLITLGIGSEIAVASTKAYYGQIIYLYKLCFLIAKLKRIDLKQLEKQFLNYDIDTGVDIEKIKTLAKKISKKQSLFFIGRQIDYYLALEGSLKLKEITYIHSETYPGGELKHGPISLINKKSLVIAIMSKDNLKAKTKANIEEILSRKGKVILISDEEIHKENIYNLKYNKLTNDYLSPLTIIPLLQLIAYYCALYRKTNIDKPKNLAKSVTVE